MYIYNRLSFRIFIKWGKRDNYGVKGGEDYSNTVESHDYAPPPLCMLALGKNGEGAYMRDPNIPYDDHCRKSNATWAPRSLLFLWLFGGKTQEKR